MMILYIRETVLRHISVLFNIITAQPMRQIWVMPFLKTGTDVFFWQNVFNS